MSDTTNETQAPAGSPYAQLGGAAGVRALVNRFYALMDELPEAWTVRRMHPQCLENSADSLFMFLSGWLGGPPLYMRERGHPRLRMRHAPYRIGPTERDAWMLCMQQALQEQVRDPILHAVLLRAISEMAHHLINTEGHAGCAGMGDHSGS